MKLTPYESRSFDRLYSIVEVRGSRTPKQQARFDKLKAKLFAKQPANDNV